MNKIIVDVKGVLAANVEVVLIDGDEVEVVAVDPREGVWTGHITPHLGDVVASSVSHRFYDEAVGASLGDDDAIGDELEDIISDHEVYVLWDESAEEEAVDDVVGHSVKVALLNDIEIVW